MFDERILYICWLSSVIEGSEQENELWKEWTGSDMWEQEGEKLGGESL